jgi:hypothetical protein
VKQQLDFWPTVRRPLQPQIWEGLTPEEQATVIVALARLIGKAVYPKNVNEIQETKHEQ